MSQMTLPNSVGLEQQLKTQRRTVDFDTFDIQAQQLLAMLGSRQIKVSPAYQRKFRWKEKQCSQFIESMMLGIPIPSLFMATNEDSTWEVVDGVQRLSTIVKFAGDAQLRQQLQLNGPLILQELEKLTDFNSLGLNDFSDSLKLHFRTRPIKVVTLNDKSDLIVRYDLFERLNTGGVCGELLISPESAIRHTPHSERGYVSTNRRPCAALVEGGRWLVFAPLSPVGFGLACHSAGPFLFRLLLLEARVVGRDASQARRVRLVYGP